MSEPQPQDDLLNRPVAGEDLSTELKQNKRPVNKLTLGLIAAVVVVAAFFGGIATHAAIADDDPRQAAGPGGGRVFNGPGNGGQGPQARGTIGTVEKVEGTDVYVKTPDGRTVKVSTSDSTQVRVTKDGGLSDLQPGQTVAVQGSTGSDGTVSAQTITQTPARLGNN
ncbi:MAG TPA: hypothetical protein VFT95_01520 [Micromonosporaceae bacterium]|nr:hypothetical protein [Micromonosporaceae bacterium]